MTRIPPNPRADQQLGQAVYLDLQLFRLRDPALLGRLASGGRLSGTSHLADATGEAGY